MKTRPHPLSALVLVSGLCVGLLAPSARAQEKITLVQRWEPGKAYHFESNTDMQVEAPGLPAAGQSTNIIQFMDVTVRPEPGSDRKLAEMKFASVKAMMNMAGQVMTYDSSDPAMSQPMLQQAFGALVGKSITLIYDKNDKFVDSIVPENFIPTPVGAGQGPDGKQFATMLRESIDFGLPTESLAVGGSFTQEKKMDMKPMGVITIKLNGKLDSIVQHEGRKHAKILMEGTIDLTGAPAELQAMISMLPGSKLTSECLFDLDRKVVTRSSMKSDMKMSAGGKEMTMKQNAVTTLKKIDDAPKK